MNRLSLRPSSLRPLSVGLCVGALGLTACGGASTIEGSRAEAVISSQFKSKGIALHDVSCPKSIEAKAGTKISCKGTNASDTAFTIAGTVNSVSGSKANFGFKIVRGVAKGPILAQQVLAVYEQRAKEQAKGMTCPATVPIPTTPTVTCQLEKADGRTYPTTVKIGSTSEVEIEVSDTPTGG